MHKGPAAQYIPRGSYPGKASVKTDDVKSQVHDKLGDLADYDIKPYVHEMANEIV